MRYAISATYFDAWGRSHPSAVRLASGAPKARFILNEVLANPLGAEPDSEWIEVVNVGLAAGSLLGLALEDSGGSVLLPDIELPFVTIITPLPCETRLTGTERRLASSRTASSTRRPSTEGISMR